MVWLIPSVLGGDREELCKKQVAKSALQISGETLDQAGFAGTAAVLLLGDRAENEAVQSCCKWTRVPKTCVLSVLPARPASFRNFV